jgi:hypothetical protein
VRSQEQEGKSREEEGYEVAAATDGYKRMGKVRDGDAPISYAFTCCSERPRRRHAGYVAAP